MSAQSSRQQASSTAVAAAVEGVMECPQCGAFNELPAEEQAGRFFCFRCDHCLHRQVPRWLQKSLAYSLAGLLFFVVSNLLPFLSVEVAGRHQETTLLSGVLSLMARQEVLLAALTLISLFVLPLLELAVISYLLGSRLSGRPWPWADHLLAALCSLRRWNMLEVFLLAVMVATVKLGDMAEVMAGPALYSFIGVILMLNAAAGSVNQRALWCHIQPRDSFRVAADDRLCGCATCGALVSSRLKHCPRCHRRVHSRIPASLQKTEACLWAAAILYLPANTLPFMWTTYLGREEPNTLMAGVRKLLDGGQWPLALIVFVASILVPVSKMLMLGYLLARAKRPSSLRLMHRTRLYRITEFIGRWSMVDVFVVVLLMALVQFGNIARVEPGGAALAFGGVVVLTMLAAESFDPRLLWDGVQGGRSKS